MKKQILQKVVGTTRILEFQDVKGETISELRAKSVANMMLCVSTSRLRLN